MRVFKDEGAFGGILSHYKKGESYGEIKDGHHRIRSDRAGDTHPQLPVYGESGDCGNL